MNLTMTFGLLLIMGVVGVFLLYRMAGSVIIRIETSRLRKQGRNVTLSEATSRVSQNRYLFVINKTSLVGTLWILPLPLRDGWPLHTQLLEEGILVENVDRKWVETKLESEFKDRVIICKEEAFQSN